MEWTLVIDCSPGFAGVIGAPLRADEDHPQSAESIKAILFSLAHSKFRYQKPNDMNINHMQAFLEVANSGGFQLAANRLHITQSTVSARIKVMETLLGQ